MSGSSRWRKIGSRPSLFRGRRGRARAWLAGYLCRDALYRGSLQPIPSKPGDPAPTRPPLEPPRADHTTRGGVPAHHLGRRPRPRTPRPVGARAPGVSLRERGPRCVREKTKSTFKAACSRWSATSTTASGPTSGSSTTWSGDEPPPRRRRAAGRGAQERPARSTRTSAPAPTTRRRGCRHGHQPPGGRHQLPEHVPALRRAGLRRTGRQGARARQPEIYNDWMIDEWCGGAGRGRLVPLTLIPLWDPVAAAAEVRRCAAKGSYAIAFSENPAKLGFPSLYTGEWDPCSGTPARRPTRRSPCTSARPPPCPPPALTLPWRCRCRSTPTTRRARSATGSSAAPWSGSPGSSSPTPRARWAGCRSCTSGWTACGRDVPASRTCPTASTYARGRVFGCIFDDLHGLRSRDEWAWSTSSSSATSRTRTARSRTPVGEPGSSLRRRGLMCRGVPAGAGQRHRRVRAAEIRDRERRTTLLDRMSTNPALADLEVLVGRWRMELSNAAFLPNPDRAHHRVDCGRLDGGRLRPGDAPGRLGSPSGCHLDHRA